MRKVLLVNDSKFESLVLKDALNEMGYIVETADEYNAVKSFGSFRPDCVIANYIMRETRGDQLIGIMKLQRPETICLLSSNSSVSMRDFRFSRIDGILNTPVDKSSLEKALKNA